MVFEKQLGIYSVGPYQAGLFEVKLFGYFSAPDLEELFKRIDGTDKVVAKFKELII